MAENRSKSDQYLLRLPAGLRGKLKEAADANARSLNAEIVDRLERFPELSRLRMDIAYLETENSRLAKDLDMARAAVDDAKASAFARQLLASERHADPHQDGETENKQPIIRLPEDLAEAISKAAEKMRRTMEDQAIDTLEKSYVLPGRLK
ncbi:Arc family DNA-binding protein [Rhizobium sp. 32-5/1]|uniref:Arc family DNA-binding protein n=1 Tax=Rhizobium sp. 32-5/1 TaxID=3019602 RepID=UPI00240E11F1|nr:Arc family DNA-binding protein [Rhizobium sp. 32-5/1]WEZ83536.1 Arc family DNA-binding protein [Rhizobium sp. 32-5/1]